MTQSTLRRPTRRHVLQTGAAASALMVGWPFGIRSGVAASSIELTAGPAPPTLRVRFEASRRWRSVTAGGAHPVFNDMESAMPAQSLPIRQIREAGRLKYALGQSDRQIGQALGIGRTTIEGSLLSDVMHR